MRRETSTDILPGAGTRATQTQDNFLTATSMCVCVSLSYLSKDERNLLQFSLFQKAPAYMLFLHVF